MEEKTLCFGCDRSKNRYCKMDAVTHYDKQDGVMLIGSFPDESAAINNTHFYQEYRMLLDNILLEEKAGIDHYKVIYTYACKCRLKGYDKGPSLSQLRLCRQRTWEEIKKYKPKLVIAMGKEAMALFKNTDQGIMLIRGTGETYSDDIISGVTVCYTSGLNIFDVKKSSAGKSEDWKRDERNLMYSDFEWIGKVYKEPIYLHPQQALNFKTNYVVLKNDDTLEKYKEALDKIENDNRGIISYDVETRSLIDITILCLSITLIPGEAYVFPLLKERVVNQVKVDMYNKSIKMDSNGKKPLIDDKGKVLTTLKKKNGGISVRGYTYAALPDYFGEEYIIENKKVRKYVCDRLKKILTNPNIKKVTQNGIFDIHAVRHTFGIDVQGWSDDTMLMYSMIDEESIRGLKAMADMYIPRLRGYDHTLSSYIKKNKIKDRIELPYTTMQGPYNAMDTDATLSLYWQFKSIIIDRDPKDWDFYKRYAMRLQLIMYGVEKRGVYLDYKFIKSKKEELTQKMKDMAIPIIDFVSGSGIKRFKGLTYDNIDLVTGRMDKRTKECPAGFKVEGNTDVSDVLIAVGVCLKDKTPKGTYKQSGDALKQFLDHKVAGKFIQDVIGYREISKKNAFLIDYAKKLKGKDRLYARFTVHGAKTGRFSVKEPNLQQIPRDGDVKNVIVAPKGYHLVQVDLSQAELRILAHYADEISMKQVFKGFTATCSGAKDGYVFIKDKTAGDMNFFFAIKNLRDGEYYCFDSFKDRPDLIHVLGRMLLEKSGDKDFKIASDNVENKQWIHPLTPDEVNKVFLPGDSLDTGSGDIHMFIASQINNKVIWKVIKEERYDAKATSFGIPYGTTEVGLAYRLNKSIEEAKMLIALVFGKFPKIKQYIDDTITAAQLTARHNGGIGIVKTELGRKRHLLDIVDRNPRRRAQARRQAVNFRIQGTCHDLMVNHTIRVDEELKKRKSGAYIVNQVHDSLLFYCPKKETKGFISWIKPIMEIQYLNSDVDFPVDIEVYERCWGGKKVNI